MENKMRVLVERKIDASGRIAAGALARKGREGAFPSTLPNRPCRGWARAGC
jgi:hypothetical protein